MRIDNKPAMMKCSLYCLLAIGLIASSCKTTKERACEDLVCTMEFRTVTVKFLDNLGKPVVVKDFRSINLRNHESMRGGRLDADTAKGIYTVASDANLKGLTNKGDTVLVFAKHPLSNVLKEGKFVISGGVCACHIAKVSGPDTIVFE